MPARSTDSPRPDLLVWLGCMLLLLGLHSVQKTFLFWDNAILWDGAQRMAQGQWPYSDFGMPTGPVSLLAPYLFFKLFGTGWQVFQATQLFLNGLMLASLLVLLRQLGQARWLRAATAVVFTFGYLALLWTPWYNTTAVLLLMFSLNLLLWRGMVARVSLGAVAIMCLFTKQDFGLLLMLCCAVLMCLDASAKPRRASECWPEICAWVAGLMLGLLIFALCLDWTQLSYWFNFGQAHQAKRIPEWTGLLRRDGLLMLALLTLAFWLRTRTLLIFAVVVGMAWITVVSSGQVFTHFYSLWVLPPVIALCVSHPALRWVRWGLVPLCLLLALPVAKYTLSYLRSTAAAEVVHPMFNDHWSRHGSSSLVELGSCDSSRKHVWGVADSCRLVKDLKAMQGSGVIRAGGFILNFSEATQLASQLGLRVPLGHPLWYHGGVSYFPREHERILAEIRSGLYEIIVLTDWGAGYTGFESQVLQAVASARHYKAMGVGYESSFGMSNCVADSRCRIKVFVRN